MLVGKRKGGDVMELCEQHKDMSEKVIEMHGDIKVLVTEFKAMNGSLVKTKEKFDAHKDESVDYRRKVDIIWAVVHSTKWLLIFLFGTGVLFKWISK
jgi:hypothetical protein